MSKNPPRTGPLPDSESPYSLELRLFGPIEVRVASQPLPHLRSRKGLWLLALLALRGGRNLERDWIAGTLWPDCDERHGRINLRQTLHDLRIALGSEAWRLASEEPRTLRLELEGLYVDVLEFDAAITQGDPASLESAIQLYRGPLLEDCGEEWALEGRRQREQAVVGALVTLASDASSRQENGVAASHLRTALRIDPYREDLLRALMIALEGDGNISGALVAYREFRALLGRQLIGEPAEETTALFKRLRDESRAGAKAQADAPPKSSRSEEAPRRTLPIPLTALIGREEAIRKIVCVADDIRLLTLTGTGGVGKTRLAIRVAEDLASSYKDGVVFIDLAPLENPDLLPDAVRAALGIPEDKDLDALEATCRHLSSRAFLLVLDNCEHLAQACRSLVESLLSRCADLRIIATSRQVLGVKGEVISRVASLAVPKTVSNKVISPADIGHVAAYREFAAVKLFAERAHAAESTFELSTRNAVAVARICTRLDGIPLAIELAAARVRGMTVERIAERLNDRFRILLGKSSSSKPIPRHETLRASIDWSYDLLSEQEQTLLLRLAVFVGGWTLEAAEAVCSGGPIKEWEVLDLLTGLVEKSMVVYQPGEDRYRLLETIRQYLMERLEIEAARAVAARHLEHFAAFAESAEPELTSPRQVDWMNRLEADHDNFRAALSWSRTQHGSFENGLRVISAIWRFWMVRGYIAEGRAHITLAVSGSTEPTVNRAKVLNAAGIMAYRQSDYTAARSFYTQSLAIRRALNDRPGIASSLNNIGVITMEQGDFEAARPLYEECLELCREIGNRWGTATCLQNLGTVAFSQTNYEAAGKLYAECLVIHRELGDPAAISSALSKVAFVAENKRDYTLACSLHSESLEIRRGLNDRPCIGQSLHDLGRSTLALGNRDIARALLKESLEVRRELGDRSGMVLCLEGLALAAAEDCNNSLVPRLYGAAEALREVIGYPLAPNEAGEYRQAVENSRKRMDDAEFTFGWAEGRAMTVEQAIEMALTS